MKRLFYSAIALIIIATVFWFGETWYFGWNWKPASTNEAICDSIATLLHTIGWVLILVWLFRTNQTEPKPLKFNNSSGDESGIQKQMQKNMDDYFKKWLNS